MYKKQKGSALVIVGAILGVLFVIGALIVAVVVSANNAANGFDQKMKAEHTNNKNILSAYNQKVLEAAQVPAMARDDIIQIAEAAIQGRYGENGSQAVFQAITEQNPSVDPQLYSKLQQITEAGRDEFKTAQTRLLDVKRAYETALKNYPMGPIMGFLGFPKVPLDAYNIVTTARTERAFETGREDGPVQLRAPAEKKGE
jgi:hypothetical protein